MSDIDWDKVTGDRYWWLTHPGVSDAIYALAGAVRLGADIDRDLLADLLGSIADEASDNSAAEVEHRNRRANRRVVAYHEGRGEDSYVWTDALAIARSLGLAEVVPAMTTPRRIQRKRTAGWRMPEGALYVGRPSRWGNPFRIYHGHTTIGPSWSRARETWRPFPVRDCVNAYMTSSAPLGPQAAVDLYRDLLQVRARDEGARLREWLAPLAGRDLACWCPEDQPCHADVLLRLANPELAEATR